MRTLKPVRILLVEDSSEDAELILRKLKEGGLDPQWQRVQDEESFRQSLRENDWELILSDHRLPQFDSLRALEILRDSGYDLPFLIVSGAIGEETAVSAMKSGAHDFISKDNLTRLVPAVERELREARLRREKRQTELSLRELHERLSHMYRKAEEASRAKTEFLATVSHELRTPLNAILGWAELLGMNPTVDPETRKGIDCLNRNSKHLAKLVEDLMDSSKIISGQIQIDTEKLDLIDVLDSTIEGVRPALESKGLMLRWTKPTVPLMLEGDTERLMQVFENLLSNAIKFTPSGGEISVIVDRTSNSAMIVFKDTGIGIRHDMLSKVFDRFVQGDSSTTRRFGGLGLGLAISKHIVELHQGCVSAESKGPDMGSTFTVRLPLRVALPFRKEFRDIMSARKNTAATVNTTPPLQGLGVLLVDDEENILELFATILELAGAQVTRASSAAEALAKARDDVPDVIVSDISMPDVDGYAFMRQLRELNLSKNGQNIPAVAVTAHTEGNARQKALGCGFLMHLTKPVSSSELVSAVAAAAHRPALAG